MREASVAALYKEIGATLIGPMKPTEFSKFVASTPPVCDRF